MTIAGQTDQLRKYYADLISIGNENNGRQNEVLAELRKTILHHGIPDETSEEIRELVGEHKCTLRGKIWKILLCVGIESALPYFELVSSGRSIFHDKILNDVPRTFQGDDSAKIRLSSDQLTRVLNAFSKGQKIKTLNNTKAVNMGVACDSVLQFGYVQGMNVLAGALLMVMPELDAFHAFNSLLLTQIPMYIQPDLRGVDWGIKLLDECFEYIDPQLYRKLSSTTNVTSLTRIYALERLLTLNMSTQPLLEALQLWDFLLAYGVHMNVLCLIAQVVSIRDELTDPGMKSVTNRLGHRKFPPLNAKDTIAKAITYAKLLPDELYVRLIRHTTTNP